MRTWPGRFLLVIIVLILSSCATIYPRGFNLPTNITLLHKKVYVNDSLEVWQQAAIFEALDEWECASGDLIKFDIIFDSTEKDLVHADPYYSIEIKGVLSNNSEIMESDKNREAGTYTIGLYTKNKFNIPTILLVQDRVNRYLYRATAEHELGHAFGLIHDNDINSIMYPGVDQGAGYITYSDAQQFCKLYSCDPSIFRKCGGGG